MILQEKPKVYHCITLRGVLNNYYFSRLFLSSAICYANLKRKIRNASTKIYKTFTDSRLKLKILERKDRQILIAVHSSGGSRPSDKGGEGDSSRP